MLSLSVILYRFYILIIAVPRISKAILFNDKISHLCSMLFYIQMENTYLFINCSVYVTLLLSVYVTSV